MRPCCMLLRRASSSADCVILASSRSLKLLPILGVPSLPSRFPTPVTLRLGLNRASSALCLGLSVLGLKPGGRGASLAELADDVIAGSLPLPFVGLLRV